MILSACAGRAVRVEDAADVQRDERLAIVSVTGAVAFWAGGGFLVYGGNADASDYKFDATERDAAGIEVETGIALLALGVVAAVFAGHYLEALHDRTAAHP